MNELISLKTNIEQLSEMFDVINTELYNGELNKPQILLGVLIGKNQISRYAIDVYESSSKRRYSEITFNRALLSPENTELIFTEMLKNAAIQFGIQHNLKVTSNKGYYLNKRFKFVCEEHGLICDKGEFTHGYDKIKMNAASRKLFDKYEFAFVLTGEKYTYSDKETYRGGHSIKWECTNCGFIMRTNKEYTGLICCRCRQETLYECI